MRTQQPGCRDGLTVLGGLVLAAALSAQKVPDLALNSSGAGGSGPDLAALGSSVYAVWQDRRDDPSGTENVYFRRSTNRGGSWAGDVRVDSGPPGTALASAPKVAVHLEGANHVVHVVWAENRHDPVRSDIYTNYSLDGGVTWQGSEAKLNSTAPGSAVSDEPVICANDRQVVVVWRDERNGTSDIYMNRSVDHGRTWLPTDVRVDHDSSGFAWSFSPQVALEGDSIYVVWHDARSGATHVYFNRSDDGGSTWLTSDTVLNTQVTWMWYDPAPHLLVRDGRIFVAWMDPRTGGWDVFLTRSEDGGVTWAPEVRVNQNPPRSAVSVIPRIAVSDQALHVFWTDDRHSRGMMSDVYTNHSYDFGDSWGPVDTRVTTDAPGEHWVTGLRVVAADEYVAAVWSDGRDGAGNESVYFSYTLDEGDTWLPREIRLDTDPRGAASSRAPAMAVSDDTVYVAWEDGRAGGEDVFFNVPFAMQRYGVGTAGSCGVIPTVRTSGVPARGESISLRLSDGLGGATGLLLFGGSGARIAPGLAIPGGRVFVRPALALPIPFLFGAGCGQGWRTLTLPVPAATVFTGADYYFQPVFLDPGAPFGWSATPAVELWVG